MGFKRTTSQLCPAKISLENDLPADFLKAEYAG